MLNKEYNIFITFLLIFIILNLIFGFIMLQADKKRMVGKYDESKNKDYIDLT